MSNVARFTKRFNPAIPRGMRIFERDVVVEGVEFHRYYAKKFVLRSKQGIYLEREPDNRHDPNLIRVMGKAKSWLLVMNKCIGYVPADIAMHLVESGIEDKVQVHLREVSVGRRSHIGISFDVLGPQEDYCKYRSQPADSPLDSRLLTVAGIARKKAA